MMDKSPNITSGTTSQTGQSRSNSFPRSVSTQPATHSDQRNNPSKQSSTSNSAVHSPLTSRDPSPIRLPRPPASTSKSQPRSRSRRNSLVDTSPTRPSRTGVPQPQQAGSRVLTAATTPALAPTARDSSVRGSSPQKSTTSDQAKEGAPRWPISPRLRSPPPQLHRPSITQALRTDQDPAAPGAPHTSSPSLTPPESSQMSESESEDIQLQSGLRTPAHGSTLETVQEVSLPNSPKLVTDAAMEQVKEKLESELAHRAGGGYPVDAKALRAKPYLYAMESGSESGSMRVENRKPVGGVAPPPLMSRQSSSMSTKGSKAKTEGSTTQNMTVETETVVSVPSVVLAPAGAQGGSGTLKHRPSTETIKPKKEKKRSRKQPAVGTGAASSKAEIFEAKVASAVDEADDSDSEETFVYDSNPPDGPRRFHSRTPSATSMLSQADRTAMRSIHAVMESSGPPLGVRKNMKFANTFSNMGESFASGDDDGKGSGRGNAGSGRGTARHHHHVSRWGGRSGHPSIFDNESPFPVPPRNKFSAANSRQSSGPPSPRGPHTRSGTNGKRPSLPMTNSYDFDDTTGADDERTPLMWSSSRGYRTTRHRRGGPSHRELEAQSYRSQPSYLNRFAACLVVTMMVVLVVTGAISFMFATSQPLTNIELTGIHHVIASEPELMFDVTVRAHNPNIVVVAIDNANMEIFAKSIHAGTDSEWYKYPNGPPVEDGDNGGDTGDVHINDDPPPDMPDEDSAPNMRLGTITEFDSPLTFEGSFFHKGMSSSTAGMRLHLPGNHTAGGSERWGRILQDEFDLVIKGTVKYNLPLSQKVRTVSVSARTRVKPNSANDPSLKPNSTIPFSLRRAPTRLA